MKKRNFLFIIFLIYASLISMAQTKTYRQISHKEAKEIMDSKKDILILDVRTVREFDAGHIKNAGCVPVDEIENTFKSMPIDKDKLILVYCRSGRRSKIAAQKLADMGFTNVYEFGGVLHWSYGIVRD